MMNAATRKRLELAGWRVGSADDFLGLSAVESALVEVKLALSGALRKRRATLRLSQRDLADRLSSSQSRVAKMEAADPDVSIDLLLRALLATGASRRDLGRMISVPIKQLAAGPPARGRPPAALPTAPIESRRRRGA
jgi:transcriptional regulator with XRE-family HTH domain